MKFYERSLQGALSSAARGFAARSRVLARLVSLAKIGELATIPYKFSFVLRPDEGKYHRLKNDVQEIKVD